MTPVAVAAALLSLAADPAPKPDPLFAPDNLVAWCIVPFDGKKRSPEDRVAMLKRLGFKRYAYDWRAEHLPTFDRELAALKAAGIELTAVWFPALDKDGRFLLDALKTHDVKTQLWVMVGDPGGADQAAKVKAAADRLAPLADEAAKQGCRVGLYNHGGWGGEPENMAAVVDALGRPNVGIVYNLHHGHAHLGRLADALKRMLPHLYCVNLNGMAADGEAKPDRKILVIGEGDRDPDVLRVVQTSGYRGPVGVLGHTNDDAEDRLRDNLDGLAFVARQSAGEKPTAHPAPRTGTAQGLRVRATRPTPTRPLVFTVSGFSDDERKLLRKHPARVAADILPAWFRVFVAAPGKPDDEVLKGQPVAGAWAADGDAVRFATRFPPTAGVTYRAYFDRRAVFGHDEESLPLRAEYAAPAADPTPPATVTAIYPSNDVLPENALRLYVHFSAPMTRGDVYRHLKLTEGGREVSRPFLELGEELWSADGKRLTVLFDPGRVKRGLKPREEAGPVLEAGKKYTLTINKGWPDENGTPLAEPVRKAFTAGPADATPIDPAKWVVTPPKAGTTDPLVIDLGEPLDHALLHRLVWVTAGGKRVEGTVAVRDRENTWAFTPAAAWAAGAHRLVIDTRLEDPCGNRVGEPFELDTFKPIPKAPEGKTVEVRFAVK